MKAEASMARSIYKLLFGRKHCSGQNNNHSHSIVEGGFEEIS